MAREGKYAEAATEMEKAIEITKSHHEKESPEEWTIWNLFLGNQTEKKVGAIPSVNEENALSNLATFYINLGTMRLLNGQEKEARRCCQEGERIAKRALDSEAHTEAQKCLKTIRETVKENKNKS